MVVKIWQLLGPFYILLVLLLIWYAVMPEKIKAGFIKVLIVTTLILNVFYFMTFIPQNLWRFDRFRSGPTKINAATSNGLDVFANSLRAVLPPDSSGCVYEYNDVPTVFLISELYPQKFRPLDPLGDISNCQYLILPGSKQLIKND